MSEPRTIWLQYSFDMLDKHDDQPFPGGTRYHHDAVVRELVEAGTAMVEQAIFHDREYLSADLIAKLDDLRAALAKIAQEGKP
ncbi:MULTISPECIES: hypothetical protein [Paracoccus]|uniref:hypothetical protein n=1 Tax=Paracoccus TaxID=265 RepID=UPI00086C32D6|nr:MULTISPECIES: hypothetical protein [Paracoccus]ODT60977.1 MAG: hypothetical protein ABS73_03830 [Paracoccus sp. SCN 68-21]